MLKHFYFSTTLLFVLIQIFLLTDTMATPKKRKRNISIRQIRQQAKNKRRKLKKLNITAPVQGVVAAEDVHQAETNTVPVQGVAAVEEVHPAETDTNNNHVCPDHGNVDNEFHKDDTPTNNNPVPDLVPSLCQFIDRKKTLQTALKYLTRTRVWLYCLTRKL